MASKVDIQGMSRLGKQPIIIPKGVEVSISVGAVQFKGPKGTMQQKIPAAVKVAQEADKLIVTVPDVNSATDRALWGLSRQLLANAVRGVTQGFVKQLEINGVGFRAQTEGNKLILNVGLSHAVDFPLPQGIIAKVEKNLITLEGIDKQLVGEVAAQLRNVKPPEPYKGKGIKYFDEVIRRKAGKLAKTAGGSTAK